MIDIERLPNNEFAALKGIDDGFSPNPEISIAIVARADSEIVGRVFLVSPVHIEGPWIREDFRCGTLAKRLFNRVEAEARACGVKRLLAYGATHTEDYLSRLGFKRLLLTVWSKELPCHQL